jgi:hypothetical protein
VSLTSPFLFLILLQKAIVPLIQGRDLLVRDESWLDASTYIIGVLQNLDFQKHVPQVMIIGLRREWAWRVVDSTDKIGAYLHPTSYACVGGVSREFSFTFS